MRFRIKQAVLIGVVTLVVIWGCSEKVSEPPEDTSNREVTLQRILDFQTEMGSLLHSLLDQMDTVLAKQLVLTAILKEPSLVAKAVINSQGIAIEYTSGHIGGIMIDAEDMANAHEQSGARKESISTISLETRDMPLSRKSAFLCPIYSDRKDFADAVISAANENLWKAGFDEFELYLDDNCGLDRFADIEGYGVVHIYSHSFAWPAKDRIENIFLMTGDTASLELDQIYADELSSAKICLIYIPGKGNTIFVSPRFISSHNDFSNDLSIIYLGFGYGFLGKWPLEMRYNAKAGAIISYDWRVFAERNRDWACGFYEVMTDTSRFKDMSIKDWYESIETRYLDSLETLPPLPRWTAIRYHGISDLSFWKALRLISVSPLLGKIGAEVELRGIGFGNIQGESSASFAGVDAQAISWSDTLIKTTVPVGGRTGGVTVGVGGTETNPVTFVVNEITDIVPGSGAYGDTVKISGYGFGTHQNGNSVLLGQDIVDIVDWTDSDVFFRIPDGSVTGQVFARLYDQITRKILLEVYGITAVSPAHATFGSYFTIQGSELDHHYYEHGITFNGVPVVQIYNWGDNEIRGLVPVGSSSGGVVVTIDGESTKGYPIAITGINDIQPRWGGEQCMRTIHGTGFGEMAETILFGDLMATDILSWNDSLIELRSPLTAKSGSVRVGLPEIVSNGIAVSIMNIDKLVPAWGFPGDTISIYGESFREYKITDSVMFGEDPGAIIYWSDTMVNAIAPPQVTTGDVRLHVLGQVSNGVLFTVARPPAMGYLRDESLDKVCILPAKLVWTY
ncbi:MAG: IPT/TIG domain-containing protein [candidate division Zixibacteria bacterium]|nr:IPT/TIG domain-containing protein [candidate division Zixibacteria bacterium]